MTWRDRERDMQKELKALEELAGRDGRQELGNLTLAAENARALWRWSWLIAILKLLPRSIESPNALPIAFWSTITKTHGAGRSRRFIRCGQSLVPRCRLP